MTPDYFNLISLRDISFKQIKGGPFIAREPEEAIVIVGVVRIQVKSYLPKEVLRTLWWKDQRGWDVLPGQQIDLSQNRLYGIPNSLVNIAQGVSLGERGLYVLAPPDILVRRAELLR